MSKKGQTSMMDELLRLIFGAILLIFIFSFFGKFAYNFFVNRDVKASMQSYEALLEEIQGLEDQENKTVPIFTESERKDLAGTIIIGFEAGKETIEGTCIDKVTGKDILRLKEPLYKPISSCGTSGCLCMYEVVYGETLNTEIVQISNKNLIKCTAIDYSLKGGKTTLNWPPGREVPWWLVPAVGVEPFTARDTAKEDNAKIMAEPREITCEYAVIPSFGDLAMVGIQRQQETVYLCMGGECKEDVSCGTLDEFNCGVYKGVCYPTYNTAGSMTSCEYCPPSGFDCDLIGGNCGIGGCKEACNRDHCDADCFWKIGSISTQVGDCVDETSLDPWEKLTTIDECIEYDYFPNYIGGMFHDCQKCSGFPTDFNCDDVLVDALPLSNFLGLDVTELQKICEADICGQDCKWDGATKCLEANP